jgi:hypothetical protein
VPAAQIPRFSRTFSGGNRMDLEGDKRDGYGLTFIWCHEFIWIIGCRCASIRRTSCRMSSAGPSRNGASAVSPTRHGFGAFCSTI